MADAQAAWLVFADEIPAPFSALQVYNPAVGGDLVAADVFDSTREVVITLGKPSAEACAFFVFQSGIPQYLAQRRVLPRLAIADFNSSQAFRARGLEVVWWDLAQPIPPPELVVNSIDPTRYVRDFVPDREIVSDLSPWILEGTPAALSSAYEAWERVAARRLLGGLVSRAWLEDGPGLVASRSDASNLSHQG